VIARHPRSYEREDMIFDPVHYLALLEHGEEALRLERFRPTRSVDSVVSPAIRRAPPSASMYLSNTRSAGRRAPA